ncbi:MAG: CBS domain-containing protein [Methanobacteriaceae archaeon]|jgi:CBS domain-containing protein|nr:CBS domain-containing protein [Methanobacteriaceae archaeon]MDP2836700.1 CBS domain-containing protein [Methanobacteriaceae archaeon]MDP3485024.1 CBS domain-containing protein [Methanobacteriaceae archaeon]
MRVKNIMSEDIVSIDKDQNICDALRVMKKNKMSRLAVINTNQDNVKEMVGMITEKDIANKLGSSKYGNLPPSHFHVSTVMTNELFAVETETDIGYAANLMLENNIGGIPVMDDGDVIGLVTKSDLIDTCRGKAYENKSVQNLMSEDLITVSPSDRLVHARRVMMDAKVGRLLVMEEGDLVGLITSKDISRAMISFRKVVPDKHKSARIRNLLVDDVMSQGIHMVSMTSSIPEVAQMMLDQGISGFPVADENKNTVGLITKTDLLDLIVEMEGVN